MKTLLLVPTGVGVGLTSACLGLMLSLERLGVKVGFMRPFVQENLAPNQMDRSSTLVCKSFNIEAPPAISKDIIERMLGDDQQDELLEQVVRLHRQAAKDKDVVVVEGLVPDSFTSYASSLNTALSKALDAKVILVTTGDLLNPQQLADKLDLSLRPYGGGQSDRTIGVMMMRLKGIATTEQPLAERLKTQIEHLVENIKPFSSVIGSSQLPIISMVPFSSTLSVPRTLDVANAIGASWLNEGEANSRRVIKTTLLARSVSNVLDDFRAGNLIVTPGDRDDILIASALATMNGVPLAGVLLTGGFYPKQDVIELCRPALKTGLPVLSMETDSYSTVSLLSHMSNEIPVDDLDRATSVTRFVADFIDQNWLKAQLESTYVPKLSPSAFRHELVSKAVEAKKRIVLPEGSEPRTVQAAVICQQRGIADCVLLAKREEVETVAAARDIELPAEIEIIDPDDIRQYYVEAMVERRKGKLDALQAVEQLKDNVVLGTMMLALDEVDGLVSGAIHTTANTVRPAFQLIKSAPQYSLVSSVFFMLLPEEVFVYGDCAINPDPTAEELAEIAIQSAESASAFGILPRVAMISYSTGESGTGVDVDKVRKATQIAKQRQPDLLIDGPLQYDAASVASVGKQKAPDSKVAGRANVFIFPDLNTGNTTYKAVQRSANVVSVGPMLQGLNKPVNDLSRGALVDDIVFTIALTAIQASQNSSKQATK